MAQPFAVGIDAASAARIRELAGRRVGFLDRVFTAAELVECANRPERLAARWAAKEAVRKLAGSRGERLPAFREIEVTRAPGGAPQVTIAGQHRLGLKLSLTHEGDLAIAVAVQMGGRAMATSVPAMLRLPGRPDDGNKGTFGTAVVVAGGHGFSGAAYLSAMGAARGGAGLVRLCVPAGLLPILAVKCTEVMTHGLPDGGAGVLTAAAVPLLREQHLPHAAAVVLGPGIGRDPRTVEAVEQLLAEIPCPCVVDADGLNIGAALGLDWRGAGQPVVLTPHPGEMARLVGRDIVAVQADRRAVAERYAVERGVVVVLKGAETVVAAPDGRVHVGPARLVALATGGSGDVLAGLCGALLSAGLPAFEAAVAAVTIHAEAGAAVQASRGRAGALASDLLEELPAAQERLRCALEGGEGG
ncbi:MAG: NAD(P)H-hydrate dehydratase [Candidatus Dormibacteria bacterium]